MGHYDTTMIGIRTGGVFSDPTDIDDMKTRITRIVAEHVARGEHIGISDDPSYCMSKELTGSKGSMVVLAGVFNYWEFEKASGFAKELSKEFGTEVIVTTWCQNRDDVDSAIYLDGQPLDDTNEHPLSSVLRRIAG